MLRRTSKTVKEQVDNMCLHTVVRLCREEWDSRDYNVKAWAEKRQIVMNQLPLMTTWCHIIESAMSGLCVIDDIAPRWKDSLAGVIGQSTVLRTLDLRNNSIAEYGATRLAGVLT